MKPRQPAPMIGVEVCLLEGDGVWRCQLSLAAGSTVGDAIAASGVADRLAGGPAALADLAIAVFGRHAEAERRLAEGDRVELLPALTVDPKLARRRRAEKRRRELGDSRWLPGRR
jgi:uncharacterized protein